MRGFRRLELWICAFLVLTLHPASLVLAVDSLQESSKIKVSAVQYRIEGNQSIEQLIAKIESHVEKAVANDVDCIVFPELVTFDTWRVSEVESHLIPSPHEIAETRRIASEVTPRYLQDVAQLARRYGIDIVAGSTPRIEGDSIFNTAVIFFRDGSIFQQDKLYPTDWEIKAGIKPGKFLCPLDCKWGKIVVLTCYDIEFPDLSALLVDVKPELIFVPSMTESELGLQRVQWCAQARAVEHHAYVVVANTIGKPSSSWQHFGQATFVAPRASKFGEYPLLGEKNEPSQLLQVLDMETLRASRSSSTFYPGADVLSRGVLKPTLKSDGQ